MTTSMEVCRLLADVRQLGHPWSQDAHGAITSVTGLTPRLLSARFGLGLLTWRDARDLDWAASGFSPEEADLYGAAAHYRMVLLRWCGWRTLPERARLWYCVHIGPPTMVTRMVIEGIGVGLLFLVLFVALAVLGD